MDSMHAVTSPTPTTPMTTRSSPSMECTLYPKCSTCFVTSSISLRVACSFMEMIISLASQEIFPSRLFQKIFPKNKKPTRLASGLKTFFADCAYRDAPRHPDECHVNRYQQYELASCAFIEPTVYVVFLTVSTVSFWLPLLTFLDLQCFV